MNRAQVYRVDRLRRWREAARKQREHEVSQAQALLNLRLMEVEAAADCRQRARDRLADALGSGGDGFGLALLNQVWEGARWRERGLMDLARQASEEVDRRTGVLVEARKEERVLEVLGQKWQERVRLEDLSREQKEIDEIAARREVSSCKT